MREIKFRGKRIDNGEWVYGYYIYRLLGKKQKSHEHLMACNSEDESELRFYEVIPETVGEFTGLYDSTKWEELTKKEREFWKKRGYDKDNWKGKEIFDGDVVRVINTRKKEKAVCEWGIIDKVTGWVFRPLKPLIFGVREYFNPEMCVFEVIGNRWELLEAKDE